MFLAFGLIACFGVRVSRNTEVDQLTLAVRVWSGKSGLGGGMAVDCVRSLSGDATF